MSQPLEELQQVLNAIEDRRKFHKLEYYRPYAFQKAFHHARGHNTPENFARQKMLMSGNQQGKTLCGAMELAMHLTGQYPDWWEGIRFERPINAQCGSNTNEQTRDVVQKELFGDPDDERLLGTGSVPRDCIREKVRKPGVPNAFDSVRVRHVSGGASRITFRAYEQGAKKHMGSRIDYGWMDEEPPSDVYAQYHRGTFSTEGFLAITFTPEEGMTEVVHWFMSNIQNGQALITATWEDAPHLTPARREELLAQMKPHERDMRSRGIPLMGTGLVFPVNDDQLRVDPFDIPDHWPKLIGMDFGWEHPTAAAWQAWDRDNDTVFLYRGFREPQARIPVVASAIKRGESDWIPVVWPHDGMKKDPQSGRPLAQLYRDEGLNMLVNCFSNPPAPGQKEGQGGQGVEVGLLAMLTAMEEGRYKVFATFREWWAEKATYHRQDGKVVRLRDDIMSASRYAFQSKRFAGTPPRFGITRPKAKKGLRNW